jgi:mono/diheme cytochrome c family protein
MSAPETNDPRFDRAAIGDDQLVDAHEKALGPQPDEGAHYALRPLILLFVLSGCVLFAATYLNRYSGHFSPLIFDENALPSTGVVAFKVDPVAQGKKLFNSAGACVTCHQATGLGIAGVYPPLAGSEWAVGPEERVIRILLYGLKGPIQVKGTNYPGAAVMPSFGTSGFNWSDDKIAQVLTYVRQEWDNKAPAIDAAKVAQIRAQVGDRKEWTQEELLQVK